jgi:ABC-2 type transport system permease protein
MSFAAAAWTIARKDLRMFFRDRTALLLGFALPLALCAVFGFVTKFVFAGEGGLSKTTLWVADLDGSEPSRAFVEALRGAETIRLRPGPDDDPESAESLRKKVEDGEAHHALVVEEGFGEALAAGRLPTLRMFRDPDRSLEAQMVSIGLLQAFFETAGKDHAPLLTARAMELLGLPAQWHDRILAVSKAFSVGVQALFEEAERTGAFEEEPSSDGSDSEAGPDFSSVMRDLVPVEAFDLKPPERPKRLTYMLAHTMSGIGVMMLMFGLVACGSLLIQEREKKTLDRIRMTPAPSAALLGGKYLFAAICGALQVALLFAFGAFVFHVDVLADPATLLVVCLATLLAVSSFGILVAAWAKTQKQAEGVSTLVILVMSAIGGAWFPIQIVDDLPLPALVASRATLTHWSVSAYQGLFWYGKRWTDPAMLTSIGVLLAFAVVAGVAAWLLYRRRYVRT